MYLQRCRGWSDKTWELIDFDSFGGHFKSLSPTEQISHSKFVHDLQSLGTKKAQMATRIGVLGEEVTQCPCCRSPSAPESPFHLLHCPKNPACTQTILEFSEITIKKADDCWGITLIRNALEQWMLDPTQQPDPYNFCSPQLEHFQFSAEKGQLIQQAFSEQMAIGWHNAMHGYFTKAWAHLAAFHQYNPGALNMKDGQGRIQQLTRDIVHRVTTAIWKG